jgi:hypothetical protein
MVTSHLDGAVLEPEFAAHHGDHDHPLQHESAGLQGKQGVDSPAEGAQPRGPRCPGDQQPVQGGKERLGR